MTVSVKAPTSTTGSIQLNGSDVLTIDSSGNVTAPNKLISTGHVLQVVSSTYSSSVSSTTTTRVDTGLTATITPSSTSSKILVLVSQVIFKNPTSSQGAKVWLMRNSTDLVSHARVGLTDTATNGCWVGWGTSYLDSPNTTSAITYKTQFANHNATGVVYANLDNDTSQITLLEIAG